MESPAKHLSEFFRAYSLNGWKTQVVKHPEVSVAGYDVPGVGRHATINEFVIVGVVGDEVPSVHDVGFDSIGLVDEQSYDVFGYFGGVVRTQHFLVFFQNFSRIGIGKPERSSPQRVEEPAQRVLACLGMQARRVFVSMTTIMRHADDV